MPISIQDLVLNLEVKPPTQVKLRKTAKNEAYPEGSVCSEKATMR
jgi:hypothetical protein